MAFMKLYKQFIERSQYATLFLALKILGRFSNFTVTVEVRTILNACSSDNRASNYMKQELTKLKGEIDKFKPVLEISQAFSSKAKHTPSL